MARQVVADGKPYDKRPKIIWGQEVIARERALAPHPHPHHKGKLVPSRGATKVLLADGQEAIECDVCGWLNKNVRSVIAHLTSHNPEKNAPDYPETTIRYVLRLAMAERERSHRGYAERVAERLNIENKVHPHKAETWTSAIISMIWTRYHTRYRIHVRRTAANPNAPVSPAAPTEGGVRVAARVDRDTTTPNLADLDATLVRVARRTRQLHTDLTELERDMTALVAEVDALRKQKTPPAVDPTTLAKAKKYDDFMRGMAIG